MSDQDAHVVAWYKAQRIDERFRARIAEAMTKALQELGQRDARIDYDAPVPEALVQAGLDAIEQELALRGNLYTRIVRVDDQGIVLELLAPPEE